ncbi:hypothetical protein D3X11_02880 [Streptococcus sp. X16XC17]|uniref:helix-turn-helix domain-containing protein n=1 Tax=unclassified Streptococcus TaxID=2608887 RepID=UPI00066FBB00|nr:MULTISPECIES: helix-turn-helix domain-containing protein [unclassified Streptococcus]TCD46382.1 hypothetical protein D3X11_02880 [Streptococcus sp. X16XC17]
MLDSYLEEKIQSQVIVLNALLEFKELSITELLEVTKLTEKTAIKILLTLQDLSIYNPIKFILTTHRLSINLIFIIKSTSNRHSYSYSPTLLVQKKKVFPLLPYRCICLAPPTAYRLKAKCEAFLQDVGLSLRKNRLIGPEYRIRCLIALLDYRYGYHLYDFNDGSYDLVLNLMVASNDNLSREILEKTPDEYLFFATLLSLGWKCAVAKGLIAKCQYLLGEDIVNSRIFRAAIVLISKNFLYDLQGLLPDYYFFTLQDDLVNPMPQTILLEWMEDNGFTNPLNPKPLSLLTLQLQEIIKTDLKSVPVYICHNDLADLLSITFLTKY